MFGAIESDHTDALPMIDCIKEFYNLPYYASSELKAAYNQIREDISNNVCIYNSSISSINYSNSNINSVSDNINTSFPLSDLNSEIDTYSFPIPIKGEEKASYTHSRCSFVSETFIQTTQPVKNNNVLNFLSNKKKDKRISNNCACTNTLNNTKKHTNDKLKTENNPIIYADIIDWSEFVDEEKEFDIDKYWKNYKQNKNGWDNKKYNEIIDTLKNEADSMKRTALFIPAFINKIGRIPTVDEAEKEYVNQGLNHNPQASTQNRINRLKGAINFYSGRYNETKRGFSSGWIADKDEILKFIEFHLRGKLEYKQGKRTRSITHEEIGYVYHIIKKMEKSDQDYILSNSLSYSQTDDFFMKEFSHKCGRHKFSGILKILLNSNLIIKTRNYKVGLRGNCYRVKIDIDAM